MAKDIVVLIAELAVEQARQGDPVHAWTMAQAGSVSGLSGAGIEQQSSGEFDASCGIGPEELDPRRQRSGGAESGGDFIHRRILPADGDSRQVVLG